VRRTQPQGHEVRGLGAGDYRELAPGGPYAEHGTTLLVASCNGPGSVGVGWAVWPGARAFDDAIQPLAAQLFPEVAARLPEFPVYISLLFQVMQGMGLAHATWPARPDNPMRAQVHALLTRTLRQAFYSETLP
jgi:hypothetical protein